LRKKLQNYGVARGTLGGLRGLTSSKEAYVFVSKKGGGRSDFSEFEVDFVD